MRTVGEKAVQAFADWQGAKDRAIARHRRAKPQADPDHFRAALRTVLKLSDETLNGLTFEVDPALSRRLCVVIEGLTFGAVLDNRRRLRCWVHCEQCGRRVSYGALNSLMELGRALSPPETRCFRCRRPQVYGVWIEREKSTQTVH